MGFFNLPKPPGFSGLPKPPGFSGLPKPPGFSGLPKPPGFSGLLKPPGLSKLAGINADARDRLKRAAVMPVKMVKAGPPKTGNVALDSWGSKVKDVVLHPVSSSTGGLIGGTSGLYDIKSGGAGVKNNSLRGGMSNKNNRYGVIAIAAVMGASAVAGGSSAAGSGASGYVSGATKAIKTYSALTSVKSKLEARKKQKMDAAEAARVDAELAQVNAQIAEEERLNAKNGVVVPPLEQKKTTGVMALAAGGLLALKALAFL